MGEIGIDRDKYLYELPYWEILLIARGYSHRNREMWSAVRWAAFNIMSCSMANLKEAGIHRPTDLLQFPWEKSSSEIMYDAQPKDVILLIKTVTELRNEWYDIPSIIKPDENQTEENQDEDKDNPKN